MLECVDTIIDVKQTNQKVYLCSQMSLSDETISFFYYLAKQNVVVFNNEEDLNTYLIAVKKLNDIDELLTFLNLHEHAYKTSQVVHAIMSNLNYDISTIQIVSHAALLHDIGKMCISQSLLQSQKKFNEVEKEYVKLHTIYSKQIIKKLDLPEYVKYLASQIATTHHERLDGSGYPKGKKSYELNTIDRIVAVADVYSAITEERSYRSSCDDELALSLLKNSNKFDQNIVSVLEKVISYKSFS